MQEKRSYSLPLRLLMALAGLLGGAAAGLYLSLGYAVAKARLGYYTFAVHDLTDVGVEAALLTLGVIAGTVLAYRMPRRLLRATLRGLVGLIAGAVAGLPLGLLLWGRGEGVWAGAVLGSALAFLIVTVVVLRRAEPRPLARSDFFAASIVGLFALISLLIGLRDPAGVEVPEITPAPLPPPSAVDEVAFVVGDAGATLPNRSPLLEALQHDIEQWSATLARDTAVSVVYTGDLVYPVGVRDRDHPDFPQDSTRLWNQIELVGGPAARRYGTLGLFIPGNHDWGNDNDLSGIDRIHNLGDQLQLAQQAGYAAHLVPPGGAPGPVVRDVRDNVRFIFIDTHWFLQNRSPDLRTHFLEGLEAALRSAGDRHLIIASHHPYQSAGPHGAILPGYHLWGVGFLLKKTGTIVQDLNAPVYQDLLNAMRDLFDKTGRTPLVFVGGHDHSLQVMERRHPLDPAYSLVSGSGSKVSSIRTLPNMHYGAGRPGYMKLLFRKDGAVDLFVIAGDPELLKCEAEEEAARQACMTAGVNALDIVYGQTIAEAPDRPVLTAPRAPADTTGQARAKAEADPSDGVVADVTAVPPEAPLGQGADVPWWTRTVIPPEDPIAEKPEPENVPRPAVPARVLYFDPDSVVTTTGASYLARLPRRVVLGNLNRPLWDLPLQLPVLDLDALGGGVTVEELTGGMQTAGLRLRGDNGLTYQFRSIVKVAGRGLESKVAKVALGEVFEDQLAAQFPLGAMVVAELLQAADVMVAVPRPVVMPNDVRLGAFRPYFAGRVGWIEERPNERKGDRPGFAGSSKIVGGETLFDYLHTDPTQRLNTTQYLRARLVDLLVGDWDRHADNWRWARYPDGDTTRWEPIPRDRDWAFARSDGLIKPVISVAFPRFVGFSDTYPPLDRLAASAYVLDHRLLANTPREVFLREALQLQMLLSDSVLTAALGVLPLNYQALDGGRMLRELQARRAALVKVAGDLHDLLAQTVYLHGYHGHPDSIQVRRTGRNQIHVRAWLPGQSETPYFDRTLSAETTKAVRLFLDPAQDHLDAQPDLPIPLMTVAPDEAATVKRTY